MEYVSSVARYFGQDGTLAHRSDGISTVSRGGKGGEEERLPMIRFLLDEKVSSGIEERSVCKFQFIAFFFGFPYNLFVLNYLCKI